MSNRDWLTVSSSTGVNNSTITLTATANPNTTVRTASVVVFGSIVQTQTITVTQNGVPTGFSNLADAENIIYPNPATNILYFSKEIGKAHISIFDINGKCIFNKQVTNNQIDISNFPNGIFTIKIENQKGTVTKKFVKQ